MKRRHLLACATAGLVPPLPARAGDAEPPLVLIDPFTAGSNTDYVSRALARALAPLMGRPVQVENRAGGGGSVGAEAVARAAPDGRTLGLASVSTLVANPALNRSLRYDPLKDFTLISTVVTLPSLAVVAADSPIRTLDQLVRLARTRPGTLSYASPGVGSAGHVLLEHFSHLAGARFMHVPYRGSGPMLTDLLAGRVDVASGNAPTALTFIRSGHLRALAVRNLTRLPQLPGTPTYLELGYAPVSAPLWFGLVGPAGLPRPVAERLRHVVHHAIASPAFRAQAEAAAATVTASTPEQFQSLVRQELARYRSVVQSARITPVDFGHPVESTS
jgi:tripartite-type tricarboxylate transporter receptor subunit TctC